MNPEIKTYADPAAVAAGFATDFAAWVDSLDQAKITVALSGGSTPKALFGLWASDYADKIDWSRIHFFWGDERCVAPDDNESNYGVAKSLFLDHVEIPAANVHRVLGEAAPQEECSRYETEIRQHVALGEGGIPAFDRVILGMGDDGHTASIFPHQSEFLTSKRICEVATHPTSGQHRITLTGPVINQSKHVTFLIGGANKAGVLAQVIEKQGGFASFPASFIAAEQLSFYLDQAAAGNVSL